MIPAEHWVQMGNSHTRMGYNYKNYRQIMSKKLKEIFNLFKEFGDRNHSIGNKVYNEQLEIVLVNEAVGTQNRGERRKK